MDKNFEQTQSDSLQRGVNYDWNDEVGQRQLNYDESSKMPNLAALFSQELNEGNELRQQVDEQVAQSLNLLESKEKSYLYDTEQFYILWQWDETDKKRIFALQKSPSQTLVSLANSKSQQWKDYAPSEASKLKLILSAAQDAPQRAQLSNELYATMQELLPVDLSQVALIRNSAKAVQLRARAVTIGREIHFAPNEWNEENESFINLLAHELAHIYQNDQNRVGANNMLGNQPINDDPRMENEADQAAKATSRGRRFSFGKFKSGDNDLMKHFAQRKVAQRKSIDTNWGEFEAKDYKFINDDKYLRMYLFFHPNEKVNSSKIGLVQTVKSINKGTTTALDITGKGRMTENGTRIDQTGIHDNPVFGSNGDPHIKTLSDTEDEGYEHAHSDKIAQNLNLGQNYKVTEYKLGRALDNDIQPANLIDEPTVYTEPDSSKVFETTALSLEGQQKDTYYGSIVWGWERDTNGVLKIIEPDFKSNGTPSDKFIEAAELWNQSQTHSDGYAKAGALKYQTKDGKNFQATGETVNAESRIVNCKLYNNEGNTWVIGVIDGKPSILKVEDVISKPSDMSEPTIKLPTPEKGTYVAKLSMELVDSSHTKLPQQATIFIPKNTRVRLFRNESLAFSIEILEGEYVGQKFLMDLGNKSIDDVLGQQE